MVRETLRRLRRNPGYACLVVGMLGLGIGASSAVYGLVESVLIRPLPYRDSDQLVRLVQTVAPEDSPTGNGRTYTVFNAALIPSLNDRLRGLSEVAGYAATEVTLTGTDRPVRLAGARVSFETFPLLDAVPVLGRAFGPDEDNVVVLSNRLWRSRFGGLEDVLGQAVTLDGQVFTVVGVMAQGFGFPDAATDLWIPLRAGSNFVDSRGIRRENNPNGSVIARLAPGVALDTAAAEATVEMSDLRRQLGVPFAERDGAAVRLNRLNDELAEPFRPALRVLTGAVAFVLLIACVNVAGLAMAKSASRRREAAIRMALGGGRRAVIAPDLAEFLTLGLGGGALGMILAYGAVRAFRASGVWSLPGGDITLESSALGFALTVSVLSGFAAGLAPAISTWRRGVSALVQEGAGAASSGGLRLLRRYRARAVLVLAQIAMTTVLLVGAALLIGSFVALARVDPGYDAESLLAFQVALPDRIQTPAAETDTPVTAVPQTGSRFPPQFADEFLSRLEAAPDIQSAGLMWPLPTSSRSADITNMEGAPVEPNMVRLRVVSPGVFRALGVGLVEGRGLGPGDLPGAPYVLLVNQAVVQRYFRGQSPVGTRVRVYCCDFDLEIVGVVEDFIPSGPDTEALPEAYVPLRQSWLRVGNFDYYVPLYFLQSGNPHFIVRTPGQPTLVVPVIREILEEVEPLATLSVDVRTMEERLWASVTGPRFYAAALGVFAAVALMLAAVGVYSVLSQAVNDSTREIGIRMALGADRRRVLANVLAQAGIVAAIGLTIGLLAALSASRLVESMLFGVTPLDPIGFLTASFLLLAIVAAAAWIPAVRATRIDPMRALRHQ